MPECLECEVPLQYYKKERYINTLTYLLSAGHNSTTNFTRHDGVWSVYSGGHSRKSRSRFVLAQCTLSHSVGLQFVVLCLYEFFFNFLLRAKGLFLPRNAMISGIRGASRPTCVLYRKIFIKILLQIYY